MKARGSIELTALLSVVVLTGVGLAEVRVPVTQATPPRSPASAVPTTAARPVSAPSLDGAVIAAVVRSWSRCSSDFVIWDSLNANWQNYGSIPISINYSDPALCQGPITYEGLIASGADVLIISDPAGGLQQYSAEEIAAIQQYANDGHNVVGSFLVLAYPDQGIDNTGLASVFGLNLEAGYVFSRPDIHPTYRLITRPIPLFRNLPRPYHSFGWPFSQRPADNVWSENELAGAHYVGRNRQGDSTILIYRTPSYTASSITNMPEHNGGTDDEQYYYNAITLGQTP